MRVALLRNMPQEQFRSIEVYADRLSSSLRALDIDLDIIEVKVQAWSWPRVQSPMPYGRRASLHTLGLYLSRWVRYPLALRRVKADVYHILDNSYGHLAYFLDPRRTVVTSHGGTPRTWRQWNPEGPSMWLFDLAFRGMLRASRIVAVSAYAKQELGAESGFPIDRISVAHHGVDPAFQPSQPLERAGLRARLLEPDERHLLLHVGHGAARKNTEALYRALALLLDQGLAVRLVRIGGQPSASQAQLIDDLGIGKAMTHISHIDNRDLPAYYAAADAFVFPSLYEGFGVPLAEAMACGTPVVCTDSPLFREVCGAAALFAGVQDPDALAAAIGQVLEDPTVADDLRQRGLERSRLYTWKRSAQATLEAYTRVLETVGERT